MPYDREPYARFPLAPGLENDRGADPPGRPPPLKLGWLPPPPWKPPPPPPPGKPPPPPPGNPPPPPPPCPPPPCCANAGAGAQAITSAALSTKINLKKLEFFILVPLPTSILLPREPPSVIQRLIPAAYDRLQLVKPCICRAFTPAKGLYGLYNTKVPIKFRSFLARVNPASSLNLRRHFSPLKDVKIITLPGVKQEVVFC